MKKTKVILIDNDPDELFFMVKGFQESRLYKIIGRFSNGSELYSFLDRSGEIPDLIVTDLNMPGQSGLQIASDINSNPTYASVKVIVLSIADTFDPDTDFNGSALGLPKPKSLLEYKTFATDLHEKILEDLLKRNP